MTPDPKPDDLFPPRQRPRWLAGLPFLLLALVLFLAIGFFSVPGDRAGSYAGWGLAILAAMFLTVGRIYSDASLQWTALGALAGTLAAPLLGPSLVARFVPVPFYPIAQIVACAAGGAVAGYLAHRWGMLVLGWLGKPPRGRGSVPLGFRRRAP